MQNRSDLLYTNVYRALMVGMVLSNILFAVGLVLPRGWFLNPVYISEAATIILILTPIARVVVSLATFLIDHDYKFVAITSIVLLTIAVTILSRI